MSKMLDAVEAVHGGSSTEPGSKAQDKKLNEGFRYDKHSDSRLNRPECGYLIICNIFIIST